MITSQYLPARTGADSPQTGRINADLHVWHLHVGFVQLFIVGPGQDAWLACSESCYSGQVGTDQERAIATRAVKILAQRHRDDKDIGPDRIREILALTAQEPACLPTLQTCDHDES